MHLGEFRNRTLIPRLDSANEIIIGSGGQGLDLAGRTGSYGEQFTVGRDYAQGSGPAVRTLVELGMIELQGKWARVPYWQCLTLEQTHPDFQRQLRDWCAESEPQALHQLAQRARIRKGYLPNSAQVLGPRSRVLRTAFARFQADQGMVVTGSTISAPTSARSAALSAWRATAGSSAWPGPARTGKTSSCPPRQRR